MYIVILNRCHRGSVTLTHCICRCKWIDDRVGRCDLSLLKIAQTGNYGLDPQQVQAFIQSPYQDSTYQNTAIRGTIHGDVSVVPAIHDVKR